MADTITVTLLRHGVTKANQERRYLGWTDLPLIPEEMERLKVVQNFGEQFDLCITSDLLRSRQTAEMLCPTLERIALKNFREIHFGTWEMKTYKDLKANSHYRTWIDKPESIVPPRGESFQEMKQRVDNGFQQLRVEVGKRNSRNILLVAHGGVIRYLLTRWTKEQETFFEREITHEAGIRLTWKLDDWKDEKKCISLQEAPLMVKGNG
ncbi:histidine phosphatase family protein [Tetragenococcus halophilus]|uniref:histidine phosphatase family protein n=1 Tax=Tetragenococcus halophilus TaxID=51669 RepID=UPI001F424E2B|nr:histidine phosphatase family protein [Tetragenococcus halophilus]MCF1601978.1 histidine phosphatase family protein [Tetragenococcus halophilus]MCO8288960.1 histidine phosphatase family protein [Tetragenococcus halophilus]MDN6724679.1 histidine phosphatase family protein [Tetragenococcus halophilus]